MTLTSPSTFDEIPNKLLAAWAHLGVEFSDTELTSIPRAWKYDQTLGHEIKKKLREASSQQPPSFGHTDWLDTIARLIDEHPDAAEQKARFLFDTLALFLDATELFSLKPLASRLTTEFLGTGLIPSNVPRNHEERERLADLLIQTEDPALARRMLVVMGRPTNGSRSDPTASDRDQLLKNVIKILPVAVFRFTEKTCYGHDLAADLVKHLNDLELLKNLMEVGNRQLRLAAINRYDHIEGRENWNNVLDLVRRYPDDFKEAQPHYVDRPLLEILWNTGSRKNREFAIDRLFFLLNLAAEEAKVSTPDNDAADPIALLRQCLDEAPDLVVAAAGGEAIWDGQLRNLAPAALYRIWQLDHAALEPLFLPTLTYQLKEYPDSFYDEEDFDASYNEGLFDPEDAEESTEGGVSRVAIRLIKEVLSRCPQQVADIKPTELGPLSRFIDSEALAEATTDILKPIAAKSKSVQSGLPMGFAKLTPATLNKLGWLKDKRKGVRAVGLEALLRNPHADAGRYLRELHAGKQTSDADKERILERLERLGESTSDLALNDLSVNDLIAQAAKAKIKTAQIDKLWSEPLNDLLAPLDATVGRWLLNLALEYKEARLPRPAVAVMNQLARENQARLVEYLVHAWLDNKGDGKLRWLLKFVPEYGDDHIVEPLFDAFQQWRKPAWRKAVTVLEALGGLNTAYALSHIHEVYTKNKYSYVHQETAAKVLKAAAARRRCSMLDLFDELTPDFGLTAQGLVLGAGPRSYTVTVATDLSLRIRNEETGKVTKSFPKARADEDAEKRAAADSAFKLLRRNLKKVAKQQTERLEEALICNRRWPSDRWRILFLDHPLLGLLGQGLIWQRWDKAGNRLGGFRISEDRSLINVDDETVAVSSTDGISLWHPLEATEDERENWAVHFKDYQVDPFLDQLGQPRLALAAGASITDALKPFKGLVLPQHDFKRFMSRWNYAIDDRDGSYIGSYARAYPLLGVRMIIDVEGMDAYSFVDQPVTLLAIKALRDGDYEDVPLDQLPTTFIATLIHQGEMLRAKQVANP